DKATGKVKLQKLDAVALAQLEKEEQVPAPKAPAPVEREDLLQNQRDRVIIEEQAMAQRVEDALRQARRDFAGDPQEGLNILRQTLDRVSQHPDLSQRVREALSARLETALRDTTSQARVVALRRAESQQVQAVLDREAQRRRETQSFEARVEAQFNV